MRGPVLEVCGKTWKASLGGGSSAAELAGARAKANSRPTIQFDAFICLLTMRSWIEIRTPVSPLRLHRRKENQAAMANGTPSFFTVPLFRLTHISHRDAALELRIQCLVY